MFEYGLKILNECFRCRFDFLIKIVGETVDMEVAVSLDNIVDMLLGKALFCL